MEITTDTRKVQIEFVAFPGAEIALHRNHPDGWDTLACPWREADPEDDERVQDLTMELVDWAMDAAPEAFGMGDDTTDYEAYNDASINIAGAINGACQGEGAQPFTGPVGREWPLWYSDVKLAEDITVRVSGFAR